MIWLVPVRKLPYLLMGLIAATPILRSGLYLYLADDYERAYQAIYTLLPCRMDALLLGVLCAWIVRFRPALVSRRCLYVALGVCIVVIAELTSNLNNFKLATYGYTVLAVGFACVLLLAVSGNGPMSWLTSRPPLRKAGLLAYGLYMFHIGVNGVAHGVLLKKEPALSNLFDLGVTAGAFVLTWALAQVSWTYFEAPVLAVAHRFRYSVEPAARIARSAARQR
jgi:peptidoglycan/LPS O-acetylase OafA/YrhL